MSKRIQAYIALTCVAAIWGMAAVVIKYTLQYLPPYTFLTYRFWLSFLIVVPFFYFEYKKYKPKLSQLKEVIGLTFIGIPANLILVFVGINLTSALEASFIIAMTPMLSVLGGYLFLKEKVERHELVGLIIASLGTLVIVLQPILKGGGLNYRGASGNAILFISVIGSSYYIVRSRRDLNHRFSPWLITMIGFLIAPIVLTPISLLEQPLSQFTTNISQLPWEAHLGVLYMAVISGVIAYYLFQFGLKRIEASEATLFQYLGPIFGAPLAVFWLKEKFSLVFILGALIVIIGVFVAEYKPHRRKFPIWFKNIKRLVFST